MVKVKKKKLMLYFKPKKTSSLTQYLNYIHVSFKIKRWIDCTPSKARCYAQRCLFNKWIYQNNSKS
jgi:hypothetical protein